MNKQQAENLINHVVKNYNVEGTVFVKREVKLYNHEGKCLLDDEFSCSVFLSSYSIERMEANTFYNLCRLVIAKLSAMGLDR